MYFFIKAHQHKAHAYMMALRRYGYRQTQSVRKSKFVLMDHEWRGLFSGVEYEFRGPIKQAEIYNVPVFIYPHSVRPNIPFDLTDDYYRNTRALITIAEGHKEILRRLKYPYPVEVMGWTYTDIIPFKPREVTKGKIRVLFAPIHPVGTGFLPDDERELNAKTYSLLLGLMDKIHLTVRHVQPLEHNNLWLDTRVKYTQGSLNGTTEDMEKADVIIGAFTYAHMAVALGNPLIMLGEGIRPHNTPRKNGLLIYGKQWEKYRDYLRYPFNIEDCQTSDDLLNYINISMQKNYAVEDWKERFIGKPFDDEYFVKKLESYL